MNEPRETRDELNTVATDLVEYLIVSVPDVESLASLAPVLTELVERAAIRILDVVVLSKDLDGSVASLELDAVDSMAPLGCLHDVRGGMLSEHDLALASLALRPGTAALVLVTEDRWAEPLSVAARRAGGQIIAGERIPAARVESVLADGPGDWTEA